MLRRRATGGRQPRRQRPVHRRVHEQQRRIERLLREAHLPSGKTLARFEQSRLPLRLRRQIPELCQGEFIQQAVLGNFEVFTWRNHGSAGGPETERVWWHSETALPPGEIAGSPTSFCWFSRSVTCSPPEPAA